MVDYCLKPCEQHPEAACGGVVSHEGPHLCGVCLFNQMRSVYGPAAQTPIPRPKRCRCGKLMLPGVDQKGIERCAGGHRVTNWADGRAYYDDALDG
jgi:hypothetical protein